MTHLLPLVSTLVFPQNGPNACSHRAALGWVDGGGLPEPPPSQDPQSGQFWAQKWSRMDSRKNDPRPLGKVYRTYLGSLGARFDLLGTSKSPPFALLGVIWACFGPFWARLGVSSKWPILGPKNEKTDFPQKRSWTLREGNQGTFRPF